MSRRVLDIWQTEAHNTIMIGQQQFVGNIVLYRERAVTLEAAALGELGGGDDTSWW